VQLLPTLEPLTLDGQSDDQVGREPVLEDPQGDMEGAQISKLPRNFWENLDKLLLPGAA